MLKDITLGQYFPGNTPIHRMDPRTKLLLTMVYIIALFLCKGFFSYAVALVFLVTAVAVSRIRLKALFKGLKPLLILIAFTALLNLFYTDGTVLVRFWIFKITREGVRNACFLVLRIVMLVAGTFLLTYTTSPISLTDGLESLLSPLKKNRFPVHELSMKMSIALRFIPTLIEETDKIISAQKARGADFETGGLIRRAKALLLQHMVLSHHGIPEYGSPLAPKFPEAEVLNAIDTLDARLYEMNEALSRAMPGGFSEKVWGLDNRQLYRIPDEDLTK